MGRGLPPDLQAAAALGGEMGQRLLSFDWARHPLGDPAGWSPATRATVATALACRFPTVLWLGERLHLVYNDAYIPMLGDKHPGALGAAGAEVWWDIWDVVGPMLAGVVRSGVATWSDDLMLMLVNAGRRKERYFTFTYSPIIGAAGQPEGVFCAVTETTERVLGERRLRTLNALAAALMRTQSVDDALAATIRVCTAHDADLPFAAIYLAEEPPAARLYQATAKAAGLLPQSLSSLLDVPSADDDGLRRVGDLPARMPALAERFAGHCPEQALVIPLARAAGASADGALVLGLNRYRPLDDQYRGFCRLLADQVSASLATVRAYEGERRRAEALAELDRAKTTFLTNVSHEFRTPLTLMLGPLEDAMAVVPGESGVAEMLGTVQRNGQRLLRLVNSLLDFSRIEAGHSRPQPVAADIGALTAGIASSFADVCRIAGIELVLDCQPAWAEVDVAMWETIVLNLVSNAFKYTFDGSITVRTGPGDDGEPQLLVSDTGIGIAADQLPHVFDRFYRAAATEGRSAEGSGIGLALVRSLVELHEGTIEADSTHGAGTVMSVRLPPGHDREAAPGSLASPGQLAGAAGNAYVAEALGWVSAGPGTADDGEIQRSARPLVLVADDNTDMRQHLARTLRSRWDVVVAADGGQALELARRHQPDLLVADVMMPVIDGFELVAAIRADPQLTSLPVIMLSARAGIEAASEGLAAGADNYLVKPFSSAELLNQVAARLEASARDRSHPAHDDLQTRRNLSLGELRAALGAAQSLDEVLAELLASPLCCLGATAAAIGLLDDTHELLRIAYSGDMPAEAADRYHLVHLDAPIPMADAIRTNQLVVVPDVFGLGDRYAKIVADITSGVRATAMAPLHAEDGSVLGAVALNWPRPREFNGADLETIEQAATIMSRAVARIAVAEREHQIAMSLQERLLELGSQSTAAVVSATYQPAGQAMRVGGDWYTATPLGGRRVGVSVGDVVGRGLPAAAVMSQLRSALGAAALSASDPAAVLDLLDRFARNIPDAAFATVAYAIIDAAAGSVEYTCAGHPYPLIVTPDGTVSYLRDGRRPPLATRSIAGSASSGRSALPPGSLLVLYTDGLIERRAESLDTGFARLAAAAATCAKLPASAACDALLTLMAGDHSYRDDVAIIAVRPVATTPDSHIDALRASYGEIGPARDRLRAWLSTLGLDPYQAYSILLSVGEAVSNAIEHGSEFDANRTVGIEVFASERQVTATVTDSGHWSKDSTATSRTSNRGRGLTLIHGLSDDVQTLRTALGTRVTMTYHCEKAT